MKESAKPENKLVGSVYKIDVFKTEHAPLHATSVFCASLLCALSKTQTPQDI